MKNKPKPELIAPAGNLEKMKTALAFGADAVYAGIPDFSLRVRINEFNLRTLAEAIKYAHSINKKIYITINILAHNRHINKLPAHLKQLKKLKPDGLIVSDPGVITVIKKIWPGVKMHLSTQANCTNWQAAKFWLKQGVGRVILGREATLEEIKEISKKNAKMELESFVHGAMCMAYSGRCFLSKYYSGRSANLGDCVQACRWKYKKVKSGKLPPKADPPQAEKAENEIEKQFLFKTEGREEVLELVEEEHGSYILNSLDLCLIKRLPELIRAGVGSFKIEGRAKSVYYLAVVVGAYRRAIDLLYDKKLSPAVKTKKINFLFNELAYKIVNRGYTEGFVFSHGRLAQNTIDSHNQCGWEFCGQAIEIKKTQQPTPEKKGKKTNIIKVHNSLKPGDSIEIITPKYDIIRMKVNKIVDSKTGEKITSAHGGQGQTIILETSQVIYEYSVIRRKINSNS